MDGEIRRGSVRLGTGLVLTAGMLLTGPRAGQAATVSVAVSVQPDMGPRRPEDPPLTQYAIERIRDRVSADLESLERARRAARTETQTAVDAAIALRHGLAELAGAMEVDARPQDGDLALAAAISADLPAWDALLRRAIDEPAIADAAVRFTAMLESDPGATDARTRLAAGARGLRDAAGGGAAANAGGDGTMGDATRSRPAAAADPVTAAAALDAAIRSAGWLGGTDALLLDHRVGQVGPGGAAVLQRAAEVIAAITVIEPRARRRARLREAVDRLAEAWPADADPRQLAEVDRGWRRLAGVIDVAARRRALAGRVAPDGLSGALRRLTGVLVERAEAAELSAIDRIGDLLFGPGPTRDPALVSIVVGFRQAVESLDRLHQRESWLDAVARIDPALRDPAATWIDDRLLRLGAPAQRVQAARRLDAFGDLLAQLGTPPGFTRMEDPSPADRALVGNRTREITDAVRAARRERLALAIGGEAAPAAGSLSRWLDLLAMIDVVGRARDRLAASGPDAAADNPDWFVVVSAADLVAEASRAIDVAVDRAMDAGGDGGPPTDAVSLARARVAVAAAWLAAAERAPGGGTIPGGLPVSLIAATQPSTDRGLAAISAHVIESVAARQADDEDAADAHRAMAIWIASTDFDPTMQTSTRR